jgi:hypothetical protein
MRNNHDELTLNSLKISLPENYFSFFLILFVLMMKNSVAYGLFVDDAVLMIYDLLAY